MQIQKSWTALWYLNRASTIVQDDAYVLTLRAQARLGCHDYQAEVDIRAYFRRIYASNFWKIRLGYRSG